MPAGPCWPWHAPAWLARASAIAPFAEAGFDLVVLQMVLHYAEDPQAVLAEAARVLRPGGTLLIVELAAHDRTDLAARLAHRWPGFAAEALTRLLEAAGLAADRFVTIGGALPVALAVASPAGAARPSPAVRATAALLA